MTVQLRNGEDKVVRDRSLRPTTARSTSERSQPGTYHAGIAAADLREALGRVRLARHEADHALADHRLHLDLGRLRDGGDRRRARRRCLETSLEAARTDGASEWQVFRRVTVPLLAPVLSVVFITMIINVLKVFDLVITLAPGSSQNAASVIALAMWRTSFGGINDFGVGSAIAVFLFVLVVPVLLLNIKRFRSGGMTRRRRRRRPAAEASRAGHGRREGCCASRCARR